MASPLVTCLMPTYNRPAFVPRAVEFFLRQDYEPRELLIVDSGSERAAGLVPPDPRIRYVPLGRRPTVGTARNLGCELARGDMILHWDDDDWDAPHRIRYQVESLLGSDAELCGLNEVLYYDCRDGTAWRYSYKAAQPPWVHGNSMCYRRTFWVKTPFEDVDIGEDTRFVARARNGELIALSDCTFHVSIMHGGNLSARRAAGSRWHAEDPGTIRRILGGDWAYYSSASRQARFPLTG